MRSIRRDPVVGVSTSPARNLVDAIICVSPLVVPVCGLHAWRGLRLRGDWERAPPGG